MMYPFIALNNGAEIVHSEMKKDGRVKVYMETPDEKLGFKHATCYLPDYEWEDVVGYTQTEVDYFQEVIESTAHLILEYSQKGGILHAANS